MDYEKKYNEALERAKRILCNISEGERCSDIETIFPELAESEDERIRRKMIEHFKSKTKETWCNMPVKDIISYLEKQKERPTNEEMLRTLRVEYEKGVADTIAKYEQKEQRPAAEEILAKAGLKPYKDGNQWCILAGDNIQEGICGFGDTIDEALYEFLKEVLIVANSPQLKEQKPVVTHGETYHVDTLGTQQVIAGKMPQKPAHTAKEMWKEMRLEVYAQASGNRHEPNYSDDSTKMFSLCDIDEIFEKIGNSTVEPRSAEWSEEDDMLIDELESYILYDEEFSEEQKKWRIERLKSLRPQPKQEWSEEDRDRVAQYLHDRDGGMLWSKATEITRDILDMLRPQPKAELTLFDENIIKAAVAFVEQNDHFNCWGGIDKHTVIKALRSLKPHWKPSEEQMEALRVTIDFMPDTFKPRCTLITLQNGLEKLM